MKKLTYIISALALFIALPCCTDGAGAVQAAEALGLSHVQTGGHAWYGCGRDDTSATKFVAYNANGQRVRGVSCSSWGVFGKATTIRILDVTI